VLDLPSTAALALEDHKRRQWLEKLVAGSGWKEHDLVFPTSIGTPLEARRVLRDFHTVIAEAGLPQMRFHDLRHSCATMLLVQGVSARVVMEILGHSQISLTMDTYSHVIPGLRREAAERMESILSADRRPDSEREPS
jgi:site-specific recombinase XerD